MVRPQCSPNQESPGFSHGECQMRETIISPTGAERQELELEEGTGEILLDLDKKGKDRDWAGRKKRTMLLLLRHILNLAINWGEVNIVIK